MNTTKKIAVISGGSGYLGSAVVETFIRNGFIVISIERNHRAATQIENLHFKFADITDAMAVERIAREVAKEFREIDVIIHLASARLIRKQVLSLSEEDFTKQFSVNVSGAFHLFKYFSGMLKKDGAMIGIVSSAIVAEKSHSKSGSYVSAKCGLQGLLRTISLEVPFRVYSIAPSFMPGGLNSDLSETVREIIIEKSHPEDITNVNDVAQAILLAAEDKEKKWQGKTISMPGFLITEI